VPVHDIGREGKTVYLVMSLLHGGSLADHIEDHGPMPARDAASATLGVVRALEAAHAQGVIHRDVKPQNVLIDAHGQPRLSDFGIAHVQSERTLTNTGAQMGTWAFMAPEQRAGQRIDVRADIYAVGATLLNLLTGQLPHELHQPEAHAEQFAGLPTALTDIIAKATRFRAQDRYESMKALRETVERTLAELPYTPPRRLAYTPVPASQTTTNETLVGWDEGDTQASSGDTQASPPDTVASSPRPPVPLSPAQPAAEAAVPGAEPAVPSKRPVGVAAGVLASVTLLGLLIGIGGLAAWRVWPEGPSTSSAAATESAPDAPTSTVPSEDAPAADGTDRPPVAAEPRPQPAPLRSVPVTQPAQPASSSAAPVQAPPAADAPEPTDVVEAQPEPQLPRYPVTITSIPWSTVTIDGQPQGTTQWTDELASGRYTVRLWAAGHPELIRVLTVADGPLAFCWDFSAQAVCPR